MSGTYFSKLDSTEKLNRLAQFGLSKGEVTLWVKGQKNKLSFRALEFDKERCELVLNSKEMTFPKGTVLLCSFKLRGMFFFSEVTSNTSIGYHFLIEFKNTLFKSEKRRSYRLLTYPIYEVYSEFSLGEAYQGGNVINLKTGSNQTALFKNFLKLLEAKDDVSDHQSVKYRVQDLSTTGLSLHIGEMEVQFFSKNFVYKDMRIHFTDKVITIPEVKVVYIVDYISGDKNLKKFKVGLNFSNVPAVVDDELGGKINQLLREIDFNKDFENFTK